MVSNHSFRYLHPFDELFGTKRRGLATRLDLKGPFWSPPRLYLNFVLFAFAILVPLLYGALFRFRRAHAVTVLGRFNPGFIYHVLTQALVTWRGKREGRTTNSQQK